MFLVFDPIESLYCFQQFLMWGFAFFFQFSIKSSNAPNPQFEWDAVQCLSEAYMLHPDSLDSITEAFGQLYKLKHAGNWRVNAGCTSLYVVTRNITIVVKVTEGTQETLITLYN